MQGQKESGFNVSSAYIQLYDLKSDMESVEVVLWEVRARDSAKKARFYSPTFPCLPC